MLHEDFGVLKINSLDIDSDSGNNIYDLIDGNHEIQSPAFLNDFPSESISLLQVIKERASIEAGGEENIYNNNYSSEFFSEERSRVFSSKDGEMTIFSSDYDKVTPSVNKPHTFGITIGMAVIKYQEKLYLKYSNFDNIIGSDKKSVKNTTDSSLLLQRTIISLYERQIQESFSAFLVNGRNYPSSY
ncbi:hypothetical protein FT688_20715 [Aeromonas hydrophila]|nr:hypothetical protein FT688_20715 [Aeromonas hydrophila]